MIDISRLRRRLADDSGTTLMELVVGMILMTVFMGMFTTAMLAMSNTTSTVQMVSDTSNQATDAYLRLDREVRYASAISTPAYSTTAAMWHVEFATTVITRSGTNSVSSSTLCTQLAVAPPTASTNVGVLEQRTWTVGATQAGAWGTIASYVSNYGSSTSTSPFPATTSIVGGGASTSQQQLTVNLVLAEPPSTATTTSTYTFTAVNSSTANTTAVCQQFAVGG